MRLGRLFRTVPREPRAAPGESPAAALSADPDPAAGAEYRDLGAGPATRQAPPAARERVGERLVMVEQQLAHPRDGRRAITDEAILRAMGTVPRHVFVPPRLQAEAYAGSPLPTGYGQTISEPYVVGLMTALLDVSAGAKVLEIATGSGYQAAVLAELGYDVYTIEILEPLAARAAQVLDEQGYHDVHCRRADGYHGWAEQAPFDAIIVTCATEHLPEPLWQQLAPGRRIVVPLGGPFEVQRLVVFTKHADGTRHPETISNVRFVPMTRDPS